MGSVALVLLFAGIVVASIGGILIARNLERRNGPSSRRRFVVILLVIAVGLSLAGIVVALVNR